MAKKNNNMAHNFLNKNHLVISVLALLVAVVSVFYSIFRTPTFSMSDGGCMVEAGSDIATKRSELQKFISEHKECEGGKNLVIIARQTEEFKLGGIVKIDESREDDYLDKDGGDGNLKTNNIGNLVRIVAGENNKPVFEAFSDLSLKNATSDSGTQAKLLVVGSRDGNQTLGSNSLMSKIAKAVGFETPKVEASDVPEDPDLNYFSILAIPAPEIPPVTLRNRLINTAEAAPAPAGGKFAIIQNNKGSISVLGYFNANGLTIDNNIQAGDTVSASSINTSNLTAGTLYGQDGSSISAIELIRKVNSIR